jgi:ABC-type lipoprotein export system ATPase subunit
MLRLTSLRIDRFRKVKPGTVLNFAPDINLVLGKNGVGKSTLLDLIACASKLDFSQFDDEELDVAFELAGSVQAGLFREQVEIKASLRHTRPTATMAELAGQVGNDYSRTFNLVVSYGTNRIELTLGNNKITVVSAGETRTRKGDIANPLLPMALYSASGEDASAWLRVLASELLYRMQRIARLDESLDRIRFISALDKDIIIAESTGRFVNTPMAGQLSSVLAKGVNLQSEMLGTSSEHVEFLAEAAVLVGAEKVETRMQRKGLRSVSSHHVATFGDQDFSIHQGGSVTYFDQFSYGQKRLIAILHHLAANPEIVVADEITNGLHHEWIEFIVKKLVGRQSFLTSQNPVLLDFLTFTSVEETKNRMIRCEHGDSGELIWRNLTDEEANDFFISYQTGMQHVGEIMLTQGLW